MKILLLEEHSTDAEVFAKSIQVVGMEIELRTVHSITSLNRYLDRLDDGSETFQPDVLFLDAHLPDAETKVLLQHVHSTKQLLGVPIYMLTTSKAERDLLKSFNMDVQDFIVKPVTGKTLEELINKLEPVKI